MLYKKKSDLGNGACFATMQGDYIDSTGAITGGFSSGGVFERKREIEQLGLEMDELKNLIEETKNKKSEISSRISELEKNADNVSELLRDLEIKSIENIKDQSNLKTRIETVDRQTDNLNTEEKLINDKLAGKYLRLSEIDDLLNDLEEKKIIYNQKFKEFEQQVLDYKQNEKVLEDEITKLKVENASLSEKEKSLEYEVSEIEKRKSIIGDKISLELKEIEVKKEERNSLLTSKDQAAKQLNLLTGELESRVVKLEHLKESRYSNREKVGKINSEVDKLNYEISIQNEKLKYLEIAQGSLNVEIQHLNQNLELIMEENFREVDIDNISIDEDFNISESEKQFKTIKRKIDSFGLVNLLAPEEFKKLEERHEFLQEQTDDLDKALDSLIKAIKKLDRESVTKFKEAFDIIDTKFQEIFRRLFEGGEGKLVITDPDDILHTGIEVMVRPNGKKFHSINLLSGGEKALSAIALIISACFVRPLPFLLFDEIDAPLDELNTVRYSKLIREISNESQVIVITHNKRTMQEVDSLIGITSDRSVTSKVVSVELH